MYQELIQEQVPSRGSWNNAVSLITHFTTEEWDNYKSWVAES